MNRHGEIVLVDDTGREREHHRLVYGALLKVNEGDKVKAGQLLAEWDAFAVPILSEVGGIVKFGDIVEGVTMTEKLDEVTGLSRKVIVESRAADLRPRISIKDPKSGETLKLPGEHARRALPPAGRREHRRAGRRRDRGRRRPREDPARDHEDAGHHGRSARAWPSSSRPASRRTTPSSPRSTARCRFGKDTKGKRKVVITPFSPDGALLTDQAREYLIPKGKHIQVQPGDRVRAGEPLMDGPANPHDILRVKGEKELAAYLVNEIQQVYRLQGVAINDKHIEVIVRQMLRRVRIKDVGDTNFLIDEQVEKHIFERENQRVIERGGTPRGGRAAAPRHHEGEPLDRVVHQRELLPGDDEGAHRGGGLRQDRLPARSQGERHHGSAHPGRHRPAGVQAAQGDRRGRRGRRAVPVSGGPAARRGRAHGRQRGVSEAVSHTHGALCAEGAMCAGSCVHCKERLSSAP